MKNFVYIYHDFGRHPDLGVLTSLIEKDISATVTNIGSSGWGRDVFIYLNAKISLNELVILNGVIADYRGGDACDCPSEILFASGCQNTRHKK
jgi:hypothetical protein